MKQLVVFFIVATASTNLFTQNIGINTDGSSPESGIMLDVKGTNSFLTTNAFQNIFQIKSNETNPLKLRLILGNSSTTASTSYGGIEVYDATNSINRPLSLQPNGGNVGIGTSGPSYPLDVFAINSTAGGHTIVGSFSSTPASGYANAIALNNKTGAGNFKNQISFQSNGTTKWSIGNDASPAGVQNFWIYDASSSAFRMFIDASGDIGIGTTAPTNMVSLDGSSARTMWMERNTTANTAGNNLTLQSSGATSGATDKNGGDLVLSSGIATGTGSSNIQFQSATAQGSTATTDNSPSTKMTILGNGNVGIGTTAPSRLLHLLSAADFQLGMTCTGTGGRKWTLQSNTFPNAGSVNCTFQIIDRTANIMRFGIDNNGYVGIGTGGSIPLASLDVNPTYLTSPADVTFYNIRSAFTINSGTTITNFYGMYVATPTITSGGITNKYALVTEANAGNVGIGTTSPTSKLQVVGLPVYANNAAAIAGGLTVGAFYRDGGDPDHVCVVH